MLTAAPVTVAKTCKQLLVHQQRMDEEAVEHTHNGILLSH